MRKFLAILLALALAAALTGCSRLLFCPLFPGGTPLPAGTSAPEPSPTAQSTPTPARDSDPEWSAGASI